MSLLWCLLSRLFISVVFLEASGQQEPITEYILDSTKIKTKLEWISTPRKAWEEVRMPLGREFPHPVYQGCDLKDEPKKLWTSWFPRKDTHELRLNLQLAQADQTPVTVLLLESNKPVVSPELGQQKQEIVAPSAFPLTATPEVIAKHLYSRDLNLGRISQKGFHLGFSYSGSCIFISSVQLYYMKCPFFSKYQASFEETPAGSGLIRGQCVHNADEVSILKMECQSNGTWGVLQGLCACRAGFQAEDDFCKACKLGSYKPINDSGECQPCPANSRTNSEGASECICEEGYGRLQSDPSHFGCTRPPSAPLNLTIHHLNNTALILSWAAPSDLGGREEVMFDVECRQNAGQAHDPFVPCGESVFILPQPSKLTETAATITGLHLRVSYKFSVRAHNQISTALHTSGSEQSITVWKTPVIISPAPAPAPTVHSQKKEQQQQEQDQTPIIAGVLCGALLLLALIPALVCFLRRGYDKLHGDGEVELLPLTSNGVSYRRPIVQEPAPPQQTRNSVQVLESVSDRLLCGIRDVLVDRSRLTLGKELGKGEFGAVFEGIYSPDEGGDMKVAVKTMRVGIYSQDDLQSFLKEAEIMQNFDHDNVVKLLGVALEREEDSSIPIPLVILPFLKHGDLRRFLIATRYGDISMFVPHQSLLRFMLDIATGMEYLSSRSFLHRDLAARNCMLGDDLRVRVADFGLSKQIVSSDYYRQRVAVRMPIKWMAIESLSESVYTTKSDVWSFGVTMWEIVSMGRTPYPGISNHELLEMLEGGHRLKQGECDDKLYGVMLSCWHREPSQRPCFAELVQKLKALLSELPPLEASMEAHYINQGLEAANANHSVAAPPESEGAVGNIYLPAPVSSAVHQNQCDEKKENEEEEEGYLVCNKNEK